MRYAGMIKNDVSAAPGVCLSFFMQGCPFRCKGCHNPESWAFGGGKEFTKDVAEDLILSLNANGIDRTFCIMGGEPLCMENIPYTAALIHMVKRFYPDKSVYIWTGYYLEQLFIEAQRNESLMYILSQAECIIDGPYEEDKRDVTLKMRGSSNQRILYRNLDFEVKK